ncbi:hypothetical protein FH972_023079 [Carpinus fangiana]|uniref:Uncharacterized protein n=1 Tax=Carpinus fangiana TaxID=176857 RepID=A0A5N6KUK0_9ROSI|nr:hypothetical protein FH972_023079 [Carpinus fangiana]
MACRAGSVASSHLRDRRLLTSSSSITLLPFLYQTRTIQTTAPRPRPSHTLTTTPATIHARCISSSRQASGPVKTTNPDEDDDPWSGGPEESRRPPSRQHSRREQLPAEPWSHHVPFAHLETPASRTRKSHDIPLAESEAPATDNKSTLTDLERKAFYRLFQSLTPSSGDRNDSRTALESLDELDDVTRFGADSTTSYDTSSDLERILTEDPIDPRSAGGSAIERYPPALQSMAQRAEARLAAQQRLQRAYQDGEEQQLAETNPAMEEERLQLKRIERDMRAAETDQELWTILDREVFESMRIIQETEDQLAASDAVRREEAYAHTATQAHAQKPRKRGRPKKSPELVGQNDCRSLAGKTNRKDSDVVIIHHADGSTM